MLSTILSPGGRERYVLPRVAFIANALLDGYESTKQITCRLHQLGRTWPKAGEDPGYIRWFSFPVVHHEGLRRRVAWVDFYIIPVLAPDFAAAIPSGLAYAWSEKVALDAIEEADRAGVELTIGWGAAVKSATDHGRLFVERHPELESWVSSTHGDAGTAALVIETLRIAGIRPGFRAAVIGANGAIGDLVSRALVDLSPKSILLVGKKGKSDEATARNFERLNELRSRIRHDSINVQLDKSVACLDDKSEVVIVATHGMQLSPNEVPEGALVLDLCTPAACAPNLDWSKQIVLTSGCGELPEAILPYGFGVDTGAVIWDIGAGAHGPARRVLWGCTDEAIARGLFGIKGHLVGQDIDYEEIKHATGLLKRMGCVPQPSLSHGKPYEMALVRRRVEQFGQESLLASRNTVIPFP